MSKIWFGLLGVVSMSMLMACGDSSSTNADNSENSTESSSSIGGNSDKPTSSSGTSVEAPANGYDAEAGILTDARDRKKYRVVKIGNQIWMAENLNYEYNGNEESWCPNHSLRMQHLRPPLHLGSRQQGLPRRLALAQSGGIRSPSQARKLRRRNRRR